MSNRRRKKPPSQRGDGRSAGDGHEGPGIGPDDLKCLLCGSPKIGMVGVWTPTSPYAEFMGSTSISYLLCHECSTNMEVLGERVEEELLGRRARTAPPVEPIPVDEIDYEGLEKIASYGGNVAIEGETFPLVIPFEEGEDPKDFDRLVCEFGIKRYLRPIWESDRRHLEDLARRLDEPSINSFASHILVEEVVSGVRRRCSVHLVPGRELN